MMKNIFHLANRTLRRPSMWLLVLATLLLAAGNPAAGYSAAGNPAAGYPAAGYPAAYAQTGGGYTLTWWTVDTGGQLAAVGSGGYTLHSTAGQPDADPSVSMGGAYVLLSGFWPGVREIHHYYLPEFHKD